MPQLHPILSKIHELIESNSTEKATTLHTLLQTLLPHYKQQANDQEQLAAAKISYSNDADINLQHPVTGHTALTLACSHGENQLVDMLLNYGANPNIADARDHLPLIRAMLPSSLENDEQQAQVNPCVQTLLQSRNLDLTLKAPMTLLNGTKANILDQRTTDEIYFDYLIDDLDADGKTPGSILHFASFYGCMSVVNVCCSSLDMEAAYGVNSQGITPLHLAAINGNVDVLTRLLDNLPANTSIETKTKCAFTPLHFAALFGRKNAVELLLQRGVNPNNLTKEHRLSPLHLAVSKKHHAVVNSLLTASELNLGTTVQGRHAIKHKKFYSWDLLDTATQTGDLETIFALLKAGVFPSKEAKYTLSHDYKELLKRKILNGEHSSPENTLSLLRTMFSQQDSNGFYAIFSTPTGIGKIFVPAVDKEDKHSGSKTTTIKELIELKGRLERNRPLIVTSNSSQTYSSVSSTVPAAPVIPQSPIAPQVPPVTTPTYSDHASASAATSERFVPTSGSSYATIYSATSSTATAADSYQPNYSASATQFPSFNSFTAETSHSSAQSLPSEPHPAPLYFDEERFQNYFPSSVAVDSLEQYASAQPNPPQAPRSSLLNGVTNLASRAAGTLEEVAQQIPEDWVKKFKTPFNSK